MAVRRSLLLSAVCCQLLLWCVCVVVSCVVCAAAVCVCGVVCVGLSL